MSYRTFLHKDCDKEVFGPLFSKHPYYRRVGEDGHAFFTGTLRELVDTQYDYIDLTANEWTGQELYDYLHSEIADGGYMGAVEVTRTQAGMVCIYASSIAPPTDP